MVKLEIRCPSCSKRGHIEVDEEQVKGATRGLFAVNITEGITCEHSYVAYVDKNFNIRDTYIADFKIELPSSIPEEKPEAYDTTKQEIDVNSIKLNLAGSLLSFVIKGIINRYKIILVSEAEYVFSHVIKFFEYITQNSFELDISIVTEDDYLSTEYEMHLNEENVDLIVIKGIEILRDPKNLIDAKRLNVERTIIQKFLDEYEPTSSLILLKNEISRAYDLSEKILDYVNKLAENEKVYSKKLIKYLSKEHDISIKMAYLEFLYEIVENYFRVNIPKSSAVSDFLGTL